MRLSVCLITHNEEANIVRTLESVRAIADEIIVVDSHSTDSTVTLAKSCGAIVFDEDWKGFAAQKNSCIAKSSGDWILSLDADEEVSAGISIQHSRVEIRVIRAAIRWIFHGAQKSLSE